MVHLHKPQSSRTQYKRFCSYESTQVFIKWKHLVLRTGAISTSSKILLASYLFHRDPSHYPGGLTLVALSEPLTCLQFVETLLIFSFIPNFWSVTADSRFFSSTRSSRHRDSSLLQLRFRQAYSSLSCCTTLHHSLSSPNPVGCHLPSNRSRPSELLIFRRGDHWPAISRLRFLFYQTSSIDVIHYGRCSFHRVEEEEDSISAASHEGHHQLNSNSQLIRFTEKRESTDSASRRFNSPNFSPTDRNYSS